MRGAGHDGCGAWRGNQQEHDVENPRSDSSRLLPHPCCFTQALCEVAPQHVTWLGRRGKELAMRARGGVGSGCSSSVAVAEVRSVVVEWDGAGGGSPGRDGGAPAYRRRLSDTVSGGAGSAGGGNAADSCRGRFGSRARWEQVEPLLLAVMDEFVAHACIHDAARKP